MRQRTCTDRRQIGAAKGSKELRTLFSVCPCGAGRTEGWVDCVDTQAAHWRERLRDQETESLISV